VNRIEKRCGWIREDKCYQEYSNKI